MPSSPKEQMSAALLAFAGITSDLTEAGATSLVMRSTMGFLNAYAIDLEAAVAASQSDAEAALATAIQQAEECGMNAYGEVSAINPVVGECRVHLFAIFPQGAAT
jgi:hypothetical protein